MHWVTRKQIRVNRTATAWLIRRFIDPAARFSFVDPDDVAGIQERDGAIGFDAPGARYSHRDEHGRCSFEALVAEHRPDDAVLAQMALIEKCAGRFLDRRESLSKLTALSPPHGSESVGGRGNAKAPSCWTC